MGVAAAAAVLVGGAAYGVTQVETRGLGTEAGPPPTVAPSKPATTPPSFQLSNGTPIEPGTYRMAVSADTGGDRISADLTITGPNWRSGGQPVVFQGDAWAGVGVYQPHQVAGASACYGGWKGRDARGTPQALARQLVALPRSTVIQPPTATEAFGHDAVHLRLLIDDQCPDVYQIATERAGDDYGRGISYGNTRKKVLIDFWVVDVNGTPVVVDMWHHADASIELVGSTTQVRDSITFVT
jgi:hypothetical protein